MGRLPAGAHISVSKSAYREGPVRRGDVVVFTNPNNRSVVHVKRVVSLPGDAIELRDDLLLVNRRETTRSLVANEGTDGVTRTISLSRSVSPPPLC